MPVKPSLPAPPIHSRDVPVATPQTATVIPEATRLTGLSAVLRNLPTLLGGSKKYTLAVFLPIIAALLAVVFQKLDVDASIIDWMLQTCETALKLYLPSQAAVDVGKVLKGNLK